jgi:PAS domain S-box-containing protein
MSTKTKKRRHMASAIEKTLGSTESSLALLKVLAENSFDSILITDASAKGQITYANKAFKKLTGHEPSDVLGKTPRILQGKGTDKKVIDRLSVALKTGGKFEGKAINYKKDGTPFIMYWRVLPIKVGKKIEAWLAIQREGSVI